MTSRPIPTSPQPISANAVAVDTVAPTRAVTRGTNRPSISMGRPSGRIPSPVANAENPWPYCSTDALT